MWEQKDTSTWVRLLSLPLVCVLLDTGDFL